MKLPGNMQAMMQKAEQMQKKMQEEIALGKPDAVAATPLEKKKDDVTERALADPEVRRFQETFPDAQVRAVRNLKQ